MPTLAQSNPFTIPSPQSLPGPAMWEWALLEHGWAPALAIALLGVVLGARVSGRRRSLVMGLAGLLALGCLVLDRAVETGREAMRATTRRLVAGVTAGNPDLVRGDLDPQVRLYSYLHRQGADLDQILDQVGTKLHAGEWAVRDASILELQAAQDGPDVGRVQVKVRVTAEAAGVPVFSWWALDFRLDGSWRAVRIEPLSISFVADSRAR